MNLSMNLHPIIKFLALILAACLIASPKESLSSPVPNWPTSNLGLSNVNPDHFYHVARYLILKKLLFEHPSACYEGADMPDGSFTPHAAQFVGQVRETVETSIGNTVSKLGGAENLWTEVFIPYSEAEPGFAILLDAANDEIKIHYYPCAVAVLDFSESVSFIYMAASSPKGTLSRTEIDRRTFFFGVYGQLERLSSLDTMLDKAASKKNKRKLLKISKEMNNEVVKVAQSFWTSEDSSIPSRPPLVRYGDEIADTGSPIRKIVGDGSKCIDNDALTEVCKAGRGLIETNEDYNAINGFPVCLSFTVDSWSKSKEVFSGKFSGHSGAWAEDILVNASTMKTNMPTLEKGARYFVKGHLPEGNMFYGNAVDNCFVYISTQMVVKDGF